MAVTQEVTYPEIASKLDDNVKFVNNLIGIGTSWDIVAKPFTFGNLNMMSYVTNGYFMTLNMVVILEDLQKCIREFVSTHQDQKFNLSELVDNLNTRIAFVQVQTLSKMEDAVRFILSGPLVTFIEGYNEVLVIDTRIYPMRSVQESEVERLIRGPRDGFTETMLMNVALIRRRLRDPNLRVELMQVGKRTKTDISIMYLNDVTDDSIVQNIKNDLKSISVDAVIMAEQSIADLIGKVKWNPYPVVRYTERPDVAATALLEGHVVLIVDTTPEAIIAPATFFNHLQHPQEYHSYPTVGTYLRWVALISVFISTFVPGIFLLMNYHPDLLPHWLSFFKAERNDPLPLWIELIIAEVLLDMLRLAVTNTPQALSSAVGIVAGLIFGQFASKIQLLQPEVLVYMAIVMISQLAISSFELGLANQIARFWIIVWTAFFHVWGFGISCVIWFFYLSTRKSFGVPYFWPFLPFKWKNGLKDIVIRRPTMNILGRPAILHAKSNRRRGS